MISRQTFYTYFCNMQSFEQALQQYTESHTTPAPDLLQELERETRLKVLMPRMLSGHLQGSLLSMLVHMLRPQNILEIGTFTGYAALWMAQALPPEGKLYTIDINEELEDMVRSYIAKAGLTDKVHYQIGNALEVIPSFDTTFDLVFIDADKINYRRYYDMVFDKVNKNGFIIADNVLWGGKVVSERKNKKTRAIMEFNEFVHNDPRVENVLLPVRDGLMIVRKL